MSSPQIDINIEKNKLRRIKSGRINIEGTIDLHGFSLKEAKMRLQLFVGESFRRNKRLLLIITGKGRNSKPNIHGKTQTIKSEINKWLSEDFYRDKVQYISKALDKHGGEGAYYFFLVKIKEHIFLSQQFWIDYQHAFQQVLNRSPLFSPLNQVH